MSVCVNGVCLCKWILEVWVVNPTRKRRLVSFQPKYKHSARMLHLYTGNVVGNFHIRSSYLDFHSFLSCRQECLQQLKGAVRYLILAFFLKV